MSKSHVSLMNDPYTMMRNLDWSHAERVPARKPARRIKREAEKGFAYVSSYGWAIHGEMIQG